MTISSFDSLLIPCIGLASGLGGPDPGSGKGPLSLKERLSPELFWYKMVQPSARSASEDPYEEIAALNEELAHASFAMARRHPFFLSFSGDHSSAIGTWSGAAAALREEGDIGLIWIDAHMDAHTPETSETGNIHGMPLAALLGWGDERLTRIKGPFAKIKPQNLALIGIRSYEEGEAALLRRLGVRIYFVEEVLKRGFQTVLNEAMAYVQRDTVKYGVTFDLDSIDPSFAPGVSTPVPKGLHPEEIFQGFDLLHERPPFALEIVEYNPVFDEGDLTFAIISRLIEALTASTVRS